MTDDEKEDRKAEVRRVRLACAKKMEQVLVNVRECERRVKMITDVEKMGYSVRHNYTATEALPDAIQLLDDALEEMVDKTLAE